MRHARSQAALAAAISLSFAHGAFAAAAPTRLDAVQVTANRSEAAVADALASVTVLTREDIELAQAPDLLGLLGRQAGIDIARTGGPGQASTIFLRGSNSNHALVLVDGIRVNAATQGIIDFAHIPLAQVERIEIVRGPRAALWGSDAIGGVIQVFTRDSSKPYASAQAGSYGLAGVSAGIGHSTGESRIGIGVGGELLEGFSATNETAGPFTFDPDVDGYRNRNLSLRAETKLGTQVLSATGLVTDADVDFDAGTAPGEGRTDALNRVFGLSLAGKLSDRWTHALTLGHSSEDLDTPAYASRFGSTRDSLDWINSLALGDGHALGFGINASRETGYSIEGFGAGFDASRRNNAAFVTWRRGLGSHLLQASVRHDQNSQFGGADTGNVAWGWQASDALRWRASWGQGFRAPNFNELYYPGFEVAPDQFLFAGNPALQPERSRSAEIGLDWRLDARQQLGVSAYSTRIHDLIAFTGPLLQAVNTRRASIDGVELDYRLQLAALAVQANATWQDARDQDGEALLRRADRKLHLSASYRFANLASAGFDVSAVSRRPDFGGIQLPGYVRLDLRASAPLAKDWTIEARIENLGDVDYELLSGYNTPGRSGVVSLRWQAQ
jgi:vitamin B12 transporter